MPPQQHHVEPPVNLPSDAAGPAPESAPMPPPVPPAFGDPTTPLTPSPISMPASMSSDASPMSPTSLPQPLAPMSAAPAPQPPQPPQTPSGTAPQPPLPPQRPPVPMTLAPERHHTILIATIVGIVVLFGAAVAYAFMNEIGPFQSAPYNADKLASGIFTGASSIKTASYALSFKLNAEPRDKDATEYDPAVMDDPVLVAAYKRDLDKARNAQAFLQAFDTYELKNNHYPSYIAQSNTDAAGITIPTAGFVYTPSLDGKDFGLAVTFETQQAVDQVTKMYSNVQVNGKMVTLTKDMRYLYLPSELPEPAIAQIMDMRGVLSSIPGNFHLDSTISGASVKTLSGGVDGRLALTAAVDMGDVNVNVDTEFRKISGNFYVLVNKFPSFFYDITRIKGKWIKITADDIASYGGNYLGSVTPTDAQEKLSDTKKNIADGTQIFLQVADTDHALTIGAGPTKDDVNGTPAYRYDLKFNKEKLAAFYGDLTGAFEKRFGKDNPLKFDKATADYLSSESFSKTFDYFRNNTTMSVWATKSGVPIKFAYSVRMVPVSKNSQPSDHQIRMTTTLTLSDVNGSIKIDEPKDAMTLEDAAVTVTGQSKDVYQFNKQVSAVSTVRTALTTYKAYTGEYPTSLTDLTVLRSDLKKKFPTQAALIDSCKKTYTSKCTNMSYAVYGPDSLPVLSTVPNDVFTGVPFIYSQKGADYALTYTMRLPAYAKGNAIPSVYSTGYTQKKLTLLYVDGLNTANSTSVSNEAVSASIKDTDKDGLPDVFETYIGTDPTKKDTDADGVNDYQEVMTGSDPLGPGKLKSTSSSGLMY